MLKYIEATLHMQPYILDWPYHRFTLLLAFFWISIITSKFLLFSLAKIDAQVPLPAYSVEVKRTGRPSRTSGVLSNAPLHCSSSKRTTCCRWLLLHACLSSPHVEAGIVSAGCQGSCQWYHIAPMHIALESLPLWQSKDVCSLPPAPLHV